VSADGKTALVGDDYDAWAFTGSGSTWSQQGPDLATGNYQNFSISGSVALAETSSCTLTALVGATSFQASTCSYSSLVSSSADLLGYWRLGEASGTTAVDQTGAHDGTYVGGYTLGVPGALSGDTNTAAGFNGTTGYMRLPAVGSSSDWTIEGWTDLADSAAENNTLFGGFGGPRLLVRPTGFYADDDTDEAADGEMQGSSPANVGTWVYWALVRDGSTLSVYRDGVLLDTSSLGDEGPTPLIGDIGSTSGLSYFMDGDIDEVAIYGAALPIATLLEHYEVGAFTPTPYATTVTATPGLTNWWRLGEASGTTAVDQIGGANGTYVGGYTLRVPGPIFNDPTTAAGFDGTTGDVHVPRLPASSNWTIEGWTNLASSATGNNALFAGLSGPRLLVAPSGFYVDYDGDGTATGKMQGTTPSNAGTWVYWALVRDGSALTLYRNGIQVGTSTLQSSAPLPIDDDIGGEQTSSQSESGDTYHFDGDVADVAIYDAALTSLQVVQHWQSGVG
jgi:hypothetical protein